MYQDSSCRSSSQTQPQPAQAHTEAAEAAEADAQAQLQPPLPSSETAINIAAIEHTTTTTTPLPLPTTSTTTTTSTQQPAETSASPAQLEDADAFSSCPSESSSDESEYAVTHSRPSTTSTTSSSSAAAIQVVAAASTTADATTASPRAVTQSRRSHSEHNSDVRLLRKIGYIAARVRFLAKLYGDFRLVNPYSAAKQRRQLAEILLKHSIHDPTRTAATATAPPTSSNSRSLTPASSVASSYCCLPTESSCEDETVLSAGTVRRKSTASAPASILLLEDLLVQFYEDRRNKVTVIRRRRSRRCSGGAASGLSGARKHLIIMSGQAGSSSVERLLQLGNEHDNAEESGSNGGLLIGNSSASGMPLNFINANINTSSQQQRGNVLLRPSDDTLRRRRASDCSTHPGQPLSNQLQVTLKNNNCAKFPFHRGSCGAAGEHLLAANSIANRSTIILSKSCNNVDGSGNGVASAALYASSDLRHLTAAGGGVGGTAGSSVGATPSGFGVANSANATNGNGNEYSIVQLNNTIIQCHFNDDDFRALVRELKRKVEYTERMNWLCLSKRPMGPAHRKSSLPKHQDVKKRFLEMCDSTFSDEVRAALRLPAFDSYDWSDADVINLMQTMFIELGFVQKFCIPMETLREWLYEVYKHYNEVPFHNFRHCFCVAQMMYAITQRANLLERIGDLECLILLVSCICHDLDHPGYNNIYQINARTELALRYNDISPLENHHCSIAFRLLEHPECNIFKNFSREAFIQIREGIIRCILATDMARHNEILTQFKEVRAEFDYSNRSHINLLCMVLIKVADISNEARPMDVAEPWLDRLLQEFFAQSAAEKSEGLPVTPFMDPDKVSKPGSQVRFIGLVLLPLFEALGELLPDLIDMIIIPVRVALDYYKRLNDAQSKSRKSVADTSSSAAASENNSVASDAAAAAGHAGSATAAAGGNTAGGAGNSGGSISPQMPRSQSGISVKSRRSIPSQKSASRTSVDEPQCLAAELTDLPEGSESGDSETATEVDVAEKASKFKVDTEGSSNRSKSSHSTSRKSSREKRPSMIGEMCSSGQRIRNSYGNIHGYQSTRNNFGSNRAVSLDQYSTNNRRLSDGLQQVISDSNVFYNRQNRGSLEANGGGSRLIEDMNMNATGYAVPSTATAQPPGTLQLHAPAVPNIEGSAAMSSGGQPLVLHTAVGVAHTAVPSNQQHSAASNGNLSPTQPPLQPAKQQCYAVTNVANNTSNGVAANAAGSTANISGKSSWKARFKQFSDYFSLSFDKSGKRCGSTRSNPSSLRNNNAAGDQLGNIVDPLTGKPGICCTISNNLQSPGLRHKHSAPHQELINAGRNRAYSLDVPCSRSNPRYSSSSCGGGDSSRKSSRHDGIGDDNNSNNTLHSSGGAGSEMPTCLPPPIRIGSVDASDTILITTGGLPRVITPGNLGEGEPSLSIDLGMASGSSSDPPKI